LLLSRSNIDIKSKKVIHYKTDLLSLKDVNKVLNSIKIEKINIEGLVFLQKYRPLKKVKNELSKELTVSVESTKIIIESLKNSFSKKSLKSIVIIGSIVSRFVAREQNIDYHIAKSALVGLVNYYAVSLGELGISVNMLSPSTTVKDENKSFYKKNKDLASLYSSISPLKKMLKAENVVDAIKFLLSKKSKFITGQNIFIDGGISLEWQEVIGREYANIKNIKLTQ